MRFGKESSDTALIRNVVELVRSAQRIEPRYGHGPIPASTAEISNLLRRATCRVYFVRGATGAKAMALVPIAGYYRIGIRADLSVEERRFAIRHELGHILNGDADDWITLADRGYLTWEERVADLFALADLIPGRLIETLRRARLSWRDIGAEIEAEIRERWGPDWPWARVDDRARLRLRLYRECGL